MTTNDKHLLIYCDGGSRGNPGPAASAFVVFDSNHYLLYQRGFFLGTATNNQAEYQAVIEALKWLLAMNHEPTVVNFYLDSELVVRQLTGVYKIKDENLKTKHTEIKNFLGKLGQLEIKNFIHVPREQNKSADLLVNQTLDQHYRI